MILVCVCLYDTTKMHLVVFHVVNIQAHPTFLRCQPTTHAIINSLCLLSRMWADSPQPMSPPPCCQCWLCCLCCPKPDAICNTDNNTIASVTAQRLQASTSVVSVVQNWTRFAAQTTTWVHQWLHKDCKLLYSLFRTRSFLQGVGIFKTTDCFRLPLPPPHPPSPPHLRSPPPPPANAQGFNGTIVARSPWISGASYYRRFTAADSRGRIIWEFNSGEGALLGGSMWEFRGTEGAQLSGGIVGECRGGEGAVLLRGTGTVDVVDPFAPSLNDNACDRTNSCRYKSPTSQINTDSTDNSTWMGL